MDIRARDLLAKIRNIKGAENSVIAGGAVRDVALGYEPKDYDIFVPASGYRAVVETLGIDTKGHPQSKEYQTSLPVLKAVRQGEYEGIKFELMKMSVENNEDFGKNIIKDFDYGLCMIYTEGGAVLREADEFISDRDNRRMTLHKLRSIADLPKAVMRFNRLNEKLENKYHFHCPLIKLDRPKEKDLSVYSYVSHYDNLRLDPIPFARRNRDNIEWAAQVLRAQQRLNGVAAPIPAEIPIAPGQVQFVGAGGGGGGGAVNVGAFGGGGGLREVPPAEWNAIPNEF